MTSFIDGCARRVDKCLRAASVTHGQRLFSAAGQEERSSSKGLRGGRTQLFHGNLACGSFSEPIDHIISYLAPQDLQSRAHAARDYPWRRRAYDRTLSCPDLARV